MTDTTKKIVDEVIDLAMVDQLVAEIGKESNALIPLLQAIQNHYNYLPEAALLRLAEISNIKYAEIYGVSTFYDLFRHSPSGRYTIKVCTGTACHVKGAERIVDAVKRHLKIDDGDTDESLTFTVEKVACLGCCTLAPAVQIEDVTYGHLQPTTVEAMILDFLNNHTASQKEKNIAASSEGFQGEVRIGMGSCCISNGSLEVRKALNKVIGQLKVPVRIKSVGCVGMCHKTPLLEVITAQGKSVLYSNVKAADVRQIINTHFKSERFFNKFKNYADTMVEDLLYSPEGQRALEDGDTAPFLAPQKNIATEHCGIIDPLDLDEYISHEGFQALAQVLEAKDSEAVIKEVGESRIQGRGGAGFPTALKWAAVSYQKAPLKYIVMNGDEGDPGAFMDRMLLESYPFRVLEGITIAAYAVGASEGVLYIRMEYPLAVKYIREAIKMLEARGYLGQNILGSGFNLKLKIVEGAGAFVCGEETALLASIEGKRGMPRYRPPYPAQKGLHDLPTLINNVETYSNIAWIMRNSGKTYSEIGNDISTGTKVFSLAGKIRRGGLIEVPMGISIREIVEKIGGGIADNHKFKAVQIGGPSGGCIPAALADTQIDFSQLRDVGAIMGSGGLVILDDRDCMVDIARYFLQFTQEQSCGKCTSCRVGTKRMLEILDRLCQGQGKTGDIEKLEALANTIKEGSMCGLGKTAPNPVLSTIKYFRDEYLAHIAGSCPAGKCPALIKYEINQRCIGCTLCAQVCPVGAIEMDPYQRQKIDNELCTRCDSCRSACTVGAVEVNSL